MSDNVAVKYPMLVPPSKIVMAGDWHGNSRFAVHVIDQVARVLANEPLKLIVHCGDWGLWPNGGQYVKDVQQALEENDVYLTWVDGNHEDYDQLAAIHQDNPGPALITRGDPGCRIWHLPRGTRWKWHGIKWLAVGGAGSVDKMLRPRDLWWPQELITDEQVTSIITNGGADVLVSHDCPLRWYPPLPPPPQAWLSEIATCNDSARRLQQIADATRIKYNIHGHLHVSREDTVDSAHPGGYTFVTGLDMDNTSGNWRVLNTVEMTWIPVK